MSSSFRRAAALLALAGTACIPAAAPAAYLFWMPPNFTGSPVKGDEPGIGLPLPGAKPAEIEASLLWSMRAGLNVAALQCQFAPALATVKNYNTILSQHGPELSSAFNAVSAYFKRTGGKTWQTKFDQYTTRTYNGFSTLHAQAGFCETAGAIGREALGRPRGALHLTAETRMREFRNSLVPSPDRIYALQNAFYVTPAPSPNFDPSCWTRKHELKAKCQIS